MVRRHVLGKKRRSKIPSPSPPRIIACPPVSLSGFSSGGTLALVIASSSFLSPGYHQVPRRVLPVYRHGDGPEPEEDSGFRRWWRRKRGARTAVLDAGLPRGVRRGGGGGGGMDPPDPRISPAFGDAWKYPRDTIVVTAERDASALEAEGLAERVRRERSGGGK
ncbi:hypothetical protein F4778DRAFT_62466 [Xylariomycetidae sp. FL2044]|nr:hypothetical protein F4778DRAFT_62466 [Xylariomycetidae sp. FL2044]